MTNPALSDPVGIGVIGVGRIGTSHARLLRHHVPGAKLVAVADPRADAAALLANELSVRDLAEPGALLADDQVEAVVITASSPAHAGLVVAAAAAGKAVFCEKPMGMSLADIARGIGATAAAGVPLQVGFNRRFAPGFGEAHRLVADGSLGAVHLMRSVTRDPGLANPGAVPPGTLFTQTLIHDFDMLLWLNPGAEPVSVYAIADALVAPEYTGAGLLDTAVVTITFDNGALAVAEASFSAAYGYDVRAEVFGSAGMVTLGDGATSSLCHHDSSGRHAGTARSDVELLRESYVTELAAFAQAVRSGARPPVTGEDAHRAFRIAEAAIASVESASPAKVGVGLGRADR